MAKSYPPQYKQLLLAAVERDSIELDVGDRGTYLRQRLYSYRKSLERKNPELFEQFSSLIIRLENSKLIIENQNSWLDEALEQALGGTPSVSEQDIDQRADAVDIFLSSQNKESNS